MAKNIAPKIITKDQRFGRLTTVCKIQSNSSGKGLKQTFEKWLCVLNPSSDHRKWYFSRGISICPEWENAFSAFQKWALSHGYNDTLSIDRINVNGDYTSENCLFVNNIVQQNNRTNNRFIEVDGVKLTQTEWGRRLGAKNLRHIVHRRLLRGWSEHEAVTTPIGVKRGEYFG